ncbi:hypothetical protein OUY22_22290 [Nonomuraea sp. MCN248]|uniref:Core-binding (CB) domain-containing protein n=1 Tax=Nonomuraea corallina TaxID=2989783 RepID=A0ABT4SGU7_9ACTN|nr:hypothetical protein [Nonomuraea corallina]MDA0636161.1 hypothetical protein [Nonomuraea corallina]
MRELAAVGQLERPLPRDGELVDALDPITRRAVEGWLADRPSTARRRTCLRVLTSWLRWLYATEPDLEPLAASTAHLDAYCYAALTTGAGGGRPLAPATVAGRRATLASFYAYAARCGAVQAQRLANSTSRLTPGERRLLRRGIARLAGDGRRTEALAVALLEATGATPDALAALVTRDVHVLPGADPLVVVVLREEGDGRVAYPVPERVRPLLGAECAGRNGDEPLVRRPDGALVDTGWVTAALTEAARAGGLPRQRAELLHPHLLRAAEPCRRRD